MTKIVTDTEIRVRVRSIAAHHRLDMQRLTLRIARGTVRLGGDLVWLGRPDERLPYAILDAFERDLTRVRGAKHFFFDLSNWRRLGPGEWLPVGSDRPRPVPVPESEEESAEVRAREPEAVAPVALAS